MENTDLPPENDDTIRPAKTGIERRNQIVEKLVADSSKVTKFFVSGTGSVIPVPNEKFRATSQKAHEAHAV